MSVFTHPEMSDHEQVVFCKDDATGLKAIIAIHDTTLGPALGGCRMWDYKSDEEAVTDVLRLAKGMTYKAAISDINLGGGKSVIIGDPKKIKSEELFRAFGRFVDSLGGRYITAEDVNIRVSDMEIVAQETEFCTGVGSGSGDPSPLTALGVFHGIRAAVNFTKGSDNLSGLRVGIQGCGNVGSYLAGFLNEAGAHLIVSDIDPKKTQNIADKFGGKVSTLENIHKEDVDVYAPCALGAILNDSTIPEIKASIVAGGANNQLLNETKHMQMLADRNILYAPDYVINAAGVMNVYQELVGYDRSAVEKKAETIFTTLTNIFKEAQNTNGSTVEASNKIAEQRISSAKNQVNHLKNPLRSQSWYGRGSLKNS